VAGFCHIDVVAGLIVLNVIRTSSVSGKAQSVGCHRIVHKRFCCNVLNNQLSFCCLAGAVC
jgi:hypothetical protein